MSGMCGNCDCADKNQCVKKGNQYVLDLVESTSVETMVMNDVSENNGNCKCGTSCGCTNCTCGCH